jgi:hypothetical protein
LKGFGKWGFAAGVGVVFLDLIMEFSSTCRNLSIECRLEMALGLYLATVLKCFHSSGSAARSHIRMVSSAVVIASKFNFR